MDEKIDTKRMRGVVQDENYKYMTDVWQYGASHNGQCEYRHYPCAVLKLCDEVDALRAELVAKDAEIARVRDMASHFHTELDHSRATWITEHAERIRLEERLKLANATVKYMAEDSGYDNEEAPNG